MRVHTVLSIAGLALASLGCGPSPAPDAGPRDAGPPNLGPCTSPARGDTSTGRTLDFVIRTMRIDASNSIDLPRTGFNLDGLFSSWRDAENCSNEDFGSVLDPTQNERCCVRTPSASWQCRGGVDNQLPEVVGVIDGFTSVDTRSRLTTALGSGAIIMLLRFEGVDRIDDDDHVFITLFRGLDRDAECMNNLTGEGHFDIDDASLVDGDPTRPRWRSDGFIRGGRVQTRTPFDSFLRLPLGSDDDMLEMSRSQIALTLRSESQGVDGNYGGMVRGNDLLVATSGPRLQFPNGCPTCLEAPVSGRVDGRIDGVCEMRPADGGTTRFGSVGMGLGFEAVHANIDGHAPSRPAPACVLPPGDAGDAATDASASDVADE